MATQEKINGEMRMRPDIRGKTVLIIERDRKFYCGKEMATGRQIWRDTPYDARKTRSLAKAEKVANVLGGAVTLFNPVVGQLKKYAM